MKFLRPFTCNTRRKQRERTSVDEGRSLLILLAYRVSPFIQGQKVPVVCQRLRRHNVMTTQEKKSNVAS